MIFLMSFPQSCFLNNFASRSWFLTTLHLSAAVALSAKTLGNDFSQLNKAACLIIVTTIVAKNALTLTFYELNLISGPKGYVVTQLIGTGIALLAVSSVANRLLLTHVGNIARGALEIAVYEMALTLLSTSREVDHGTPKKGFKATQLLFSSALLAAISSQTYGRFNSGDQLLNDPLMYVASLAAALFITTLFRYLNSANASARRADLYSFIKVSTENLYLLVEIIGLRIQIAEILLISKLEKEKRCHIDSNIFIFNGARYETIELMAAAADAYYAAHPRNLSYFKGDAIDLLKENIEELSSLAKELNLSELTTLITAFEKNPSTDNAQAIVSRKWRVQLHPDRHINSPQLQDRCNTIAGILNSVASSFD